MVSFFEEIEGGLVRRLIREGTSLQPQLLTIAEILQACGFCLPADPPRSSAHAELVLEAHYQDLFIQRFVCQVETCAPEVHTYSLHDEVPAEAALILELRAEQRTKRC